MTSEASPERRGGSAAKGMLFGCGGVIIAGVAIIALLVAMIWWGCKSVALSKHDYAIAASVHATATSLVLPDVSVEVQPQKGRTMLYVRGVATPSEQSLFLNGLANEQARQAWHPIWVWLGGVPVPGESNPAYESTYMLTEGVVQPR